LPIPLNKFRKLPTFEEDEIRKRNERQRISQFIESLKDPSKVLAGCNAFTRMEPRDQTYVLCMNFAAKPDPKSKLFAIDSLLREWNKKSFYRFRPNLLEKISPDVESFMKKEGHQIESLEVNTLGHLDPSEIQLTSDLYEKLSKYESIGRTGASKVLHMMVPKVFVMWDDNICDAYHLLHSGHKAQEGTCYRQFITTSNEIADSVLSKTSEEELSIKHPSFQVSGFKKTLAKMIDECNYARFTLNIPN